MPRLYTFSLLFLLAAILFSLLFPLAAAFQSHKTPVLLAIFFLLALLAIAYAYLWHNHYLDRPPPPKRSDRPN